MMTDTTEVEKWRPVHGGDAWVRVTDYDALAAKLADAERVARYESDIAQQALDQMKAEKARADAAEAKLAKVEEDRDDALIALASARKQLERYIGEAEAALPAVYRLALGDAAGAALGLGFGGFYDPIRKKAATAVMDLPTPTAAELMARIQIGDKK